MSVVASSASIGDLPIDYADYDLEGRPAASAVFSRDRVYRYALTRVWDWDLPLQPWVMCNPSTATAEVLDPTLERCKRFSVSWCAGGMLIFNLFGLRSTDPKALLGHPDPVGPQNDLVIEAYLSGQRRLRIVKDAGVMLGWGTPAALGDRGERVLALVHRLGYRTLALKVTKNGQPGHPLYLPKTAKTIDYPPAEPT
jgi:hypothetical protein